MSARYSIERCLKILGLGSAASKAAIRTTFRRLAKEYHPDLRREPAAARRFVEIVRAYRILQIELKLDDPDEPRRLCPRCGRYAELVDGIDGRPGCVACLLGDSQRGRLLPLPIIAFVRHYAVFALYALSAGLAWAYLTAPSVELGLASIATALAGLAVLAATCVRVRDAYR
ncbi:MAG: DnaJ domain-containing protein [Planctomycetota bacterium]